MGTDARMKRLNALFEAFNERNIDYVVLRGHPRLASAGSGSDIDTYVSPGSFDAAVEMCRQLGLSTAESLGENVIDLVTRGIRKPQLAVQLLGKSPRKFVSVVRNSVAVDSATYQGYRERAFEDGTLDVHLVNHLAYTSPMNNQKIRVDPAVERQLLDHRREHDGVFVPAPPDELAHLVCRGVFDYEGHFPEHYVARCDLLVEEVLDSQPASTRFQKLLHCLFYEAASLVYDLVTERQYDEIHNSLYRYSDY